MSSLCRSYHSGRQYYVRVDITFNITSCHVFPQIQQCCEIAYTCWIRHSGFCGSSFRSWFLSGRSKSPKWPSLQVPSCLTGLRFHKPHSDLTTSPMTSLKTWNILEHLGTQLTDADREIPWKFHRSLEIPWKPPIFTPLHGISILPCLCRMSFPRRRISFAFSTAVSILSRERVRVATRGKYAIYILSRNMGSSGSSGSDGHCDVVNMFISLFFVFLWGIPEIFCQVKSMWKICIIIRDRSEVETKLGDVEQNSKIKQPCMT